jgi:hypothetical protein
MFVQCVANTLHGADTFLVVSYLNSVVLFECGTLSGFAECVILQRAKFYEIYPIASITEKNNGVAMSYTTQFCLLLKQRPSCSIYSTVTSTDGEIIFLTSILFAVTRIHKVWQQE